MGTKRSHSEVSDVAMGDAPERDQSSSYAENNNQHTSKRSKTGLGAAKKKHKAKEGTTSWNKTRARTIRRLLQSGKELPATVRNDLEQELGALSERVEEHDFKKKRSQMIQKYHMVRFFGTITFAVIYETFPGSSADITITRAEKGRATPQTTPQENRPVHRRTRQEAPRGRGPRS